MLLHKAVPAFALLLAGASAGAQLAPEGRPSTIGPYNAVFPAGGDGIIKPVPGYAAGETLIPSAGWTLSAWIKPTTMADGRVVVAGLGEPVSRALMLDKGVPMAMVGGGMVRGRRALPLDRWSFVAASFSGGVARLFVDGREVARGSLPIVMPGAVAVIAARIKGQPVFAGKVAAFEAASVALDQREVAARARTAPADDLVAFENGSPTWPLQLKQQYGELVPQKAWTLPHGLTPPSKPVARPLTPSPAIAREADGRYAIGAWRLAEGPTVTAGGAALSRAGYDASRWYPATVPGTVLTTLVDRGVYPDPAYGLNNLAIPERLARQDYWYRTEFVTPADAANRRLALLFKGINYAAEIWLNGEKLGDVKGAFIRGRFDATGRLKPGQVNALAVRISPPPHAGIPHEQSLTAGRGENGGVQMIDGPTFSASEGWDWMPGIRDRNSGLWQGVDLVSTGAVTIGDAQVVTSLPKVDNSVADVEIGVPVTNHGAAPATTMVRAAFDDVTVEKAVTLAPGETRTVTFAPREFPQLSVKNPKLWWPNGYGDPALHDLRLTAGTGEAVSDTASLRFGMREISYELSVMDEAGDLRRVEVDLTRARALGTPGIIDERHPALRKVPGGYAPSFEPGAERSAAVTPIKGDRDLSPHLVIRVNHVRIAARGGNIGMDDMMKRVGRDRLEPFFRLHREAHMNIVRNWVGQSTEDVFFDLADENGLMVLNDFWESTQDYNAEAEDVPLFLANAEDVVRRYRNHPSIIAWIGRNEGVPQPILNAGLQDVVRRDDGTRLYMGPSRFVNLAGSGPYNWREPEGYFTEYAKGFAVELGTPSFPTIEAWERAIPAADRWPINDSWAYHDWHQERGGSVKTFMDAMDTRFGAGTSLADFERKAQMLEYESYRAIFEGMNAGLWKDSSGRMLWMTQPAWPSAHWQIFSSDYDTHAAFYGTKKASEPVHVQMNLPDHKVVLVNNRLAPLAATVRARVTALDGRVLAERSVAVDVAAGQVADAFTLDLGAAMAGGPALVRLGAVGKGGERLSDNFYWQAATPAALKAMNAMPGAPVEAQIQRGGADGAPLVVTLANRGTTPALATKLTLFRADGSQVLPAYFSDNYVSLLPGEERRVTIDYAGKDAAYATMRGWNVTPAKVTVR